MRSPIVQPSPNYVASGIQQNKKYTQFNDHHNDFQMIFWTH